MKISNHAYCVKTIKGADMYNCGDKNRTLVKVCVSFVLALIVMIPLVGNGENTQDGVAFTGKARIFSIQIDPDKQYILLVEMIPATKSRQKEVNVFIDKNTVNGLTGKKIAIKDLKTGMAVVIDGTKFIEQNGNQKIIIIMATRITPLVE
ncbi:MAG: hypothetical protein A2Y65_02285 [Deltaproteobacteria bacterium RBG_13_52_11]|nr:MAG: hypothetical protein A2Y65_02285 [Deltaproteobacteria bacterium RBG_13_52_11]